MARDTNLLKAMTHLAIRCTYFVFLDGCMSIMAFTFSRFASIPHWDTINPRNFPTDTLKEHLSGLSFILYFLRV